MAQHKWHKEIKAWADGAEIERRKLSADINWEPFNGHWATGFDWEYRIKPQPVEPQYLLVEITKKGVTINCEPLFDAGITGKFKIRLESNDD